MIANYILSLVRYFVIWLCIRLYCLNFYFSICSSLCVWFFFFCICRLFLFAAQIFKNETKKNIFLVKQLVIKHYLFLNCNFITFFQTYRKIVLSRQLFKKIPYFPSSVKAHDKRVFGNLNTKHVNLSSLFYPARLLSYSFYQKPFYHIFQISIKSI